MIAAIARTLLRLGARHVLVRDDQGRPYMLRIYLVPERLRSRGFPGVYLHRFFRSDTDRELHNHPWRLSVALVLGGGYREERWDPAARLVTTRVVRAGAINIIRADTFHRIELLSPERGCWSLFVAGRRVQGWGFQSRDGATFESFEARQARVRSNHDTRTR